MRRLTFINVLKEERQIYRVVMEYIFNLISPFRDMEHIFIIVDTRE